MRTGHILGAALLCAIATPTFAQTTVTTTGSSSEFYVVQDVATKKCTIVDKKPTTTTMVTVGDGVFKTRTEAEAGMKSVKICTTN